MTCEQYQAQLLDYLYDLLEAQDRRALDEHFAQCSACTAALTQARSQKRLLGVAAKAQFPNVQFHIPPAPIVTPRREIEKSRTGRSWLPWAVAASMMVAIAGGSYWYVAQERTMRTAESRADAIQVALHDLTVKQQSETARTTQQLKELQERWQKLPQHQAERLQELAARQLDVVVTGPQTIQAGAPAEYRIQTKDRNNQLVTAHVAARVLDQSQNVVWQEPDVLCRGEHRLLLPSTLPLKPQSDLYLEVTSHKDDGVKESLRERLQLVAPVYLTHLMTDKPMYQPGEVVHFRSLTLERFSMKPPAEDLHLVFTIAAPDGQEVFHLEGQSQLLNTQQPPTAVLGPDGQPLRGVGAGEFTLNSEAVGGEYTLTVRETNNRTPTEKRKFIVNRYERPRLNKELDFGKKSYGPGDELSATCRVSRAEGGTPVADKPVEATLQIDGKRYGADGKENGPPLSLRTNNEGAVTVRFKLPTRIDRGHASLAVQFSDGASNETLVRPVPLVLKKLQVEFYPEGGDLVLDVSNRVYFQARTTLDKPAELRGQVIDQDGQVVADRVETLHDEQQPGANQGMGAFTFTPRAGKTYGLKIDTPVGVEGRYVLPTARADGVALSIPTGVTKPSEPIRVTVHSAQADRSLWVGAYCRGRLLDHQVVQAKKGTATDVELKPAEEIGGVYRVTVFEERTENGRQWQPIAERLIYRAPDAKLALAIKSDKKQYTPGEKVKLAVTATTEKEQPVGSVATVAVVDKSVITLADEKTARAMPTHFYLTTEVRQPEDLEYADFLVGDQANAKVALDLLLGTQGWRRFAEQDPSKLRQQSGPDRDRFLVMTGQMHEASRDLLEQEGQRFVEESVQETRTLQDQFAKLRQEYLDSHQGTAFAGERERLQAQATEERATAMATQTRLGAFTTTVRRWALPLLAIGLIVAIIAGLVLGFRRSLAMGRPYYVTSAVCTVGLLAILVALPADFARTHDEMALADPKDEPSVDANRLATATDDLGMLSRELGAAEGPAATYSRAAGGAGALNANGVGGFGGFGGPGGIVARPMGMVAPQAEEQRARQLFFGRRGEEAAKEVPQAGRDLNGPLEKKAQQRVQLQAGDRAKDVLLREVQPAKPADKAELGDLERREDRQVLDKRKALDEDAGLKVVKKPELAPVNDDIKALKDVEQLVPKQAGAAPARGFRRAPAAADAKAIPGLLGVPAPPAATPMPQIGAVIMGGGAAAPPLPPPVPAPLVVREYAHAHSTAPSEVRTDFTETLYWNPALVLNQGRAEVAFDLSDSVTSFQVLVAGYTLDGRLGATMATVESRLPFNVEPKLPIEVTAGDKIDVPISIANNTDAQRAVNLRVTPTGLTMQDGKADEQLIVGADQRVRRVYRFEPAIVEGHAELVLEGQSTPFGDTIRRGFAVVPSGFPVNGSHSDMLEKTASDTITLPETWVKGTLKCNVQVFPSTLASLQKGLEGLLREPGGCFEQTSTSNYPNLLILNYLKESDQAKPEVERRARDMLGRGYKKLISFECLEPAQNQRRGYEWFGGTAPAHEALTAYGLLQFRDMARVYDVDAAMVERTKKYLLSRKDGKGGFLRNDKALDTFGRAPENITNAYIVWALTESGKEDDVTKELNALYEQAKASKDPYFVALVANSLINRNRTADCDPLFKTLVTAQQKDGHLDAAQTSVTGSGGRDLQIETTGLAILAWLKANRPEFTPQVQSAIGWLGQQRGGHGSFGSTQSTILALKALIAYTKANKKTAEAGELSLHVGDQTVARLPFPAGAQEVLTLDLADAEKHLRPGKNAVGVELTGKNAFPYTLAWSYQTLKPLSAAGCPVHLQTTLDRQAAKEGEAVHLTVKVENVSGKGQGMTVAIVGLPAGLTLPEDMKQLKEHARLRNDGAEPGLISAWEIRGRELVLYWRDLAPEAKIEVPVDLICRVPGEYTGPASRAYLYYNADLKDWVEPLRMTIKAGE